jgi:hypothetical protein
MSRVHLEDRPGVNQQMEMLHTGVMTDAEYGWYVPMVPPDGF